MKHLDDLLLLGDPRLYETCEPVLESDLPLVPGWVADLHNVMEEIRAKYQFGRGIAAPQLGIMKRLIYLNVDQPQVIINPELVTVSDETAELWDDCMSFPNLLVRVRTPSKPDANLPRRTLATAYLGGNGLGPVGVDSTRI